MCGLLMTNSAYSAIYGEDSRKDLFEVSNPKLSDLSSSSVALIDSRGITSITDELFNIHGPTLAANELLCSGERFEGQPVVAFCSGVLVASDLVLTAGHCMPNEAQCRLTKFAFGLTLSDPSQKDLLVPRSEIYSCAELIHTQEGHFDEVLADFALVRLERPVHGHSIAVANRSSSLPKGRQVVAFGYPNGIPLKYVDGTVRSNNPSLPFFVTNLDTFNRNSGSPVFDSESGLLEGVVVDGEDDFVSDGKCFRSKHCPEDGCRGESVTRILEILPFLDD